MKTSLSRLLSEPMPKIRASVLRGSLSAKGRRFGIVVSRFNELLTDRLLSGAVDTLLACGAKAKDITVVSVPGAFEVPLATQKLAQRIKPDALITLSVVIRGKTKHFDQVVVESARGIRELIQAKGLPVVLGMIAADSIEDAAERVGIKQMNKGREWALTAVEMANLMPVIDSQRGS